MANELTQILISVPPEKVSAFEEFFLYEKLLKNRSWARIVKRDETIVEISEGSESREIPSKQYQVIFYNRQDAEDFKASLEESRIVPSAKEWVVMGPMSISTFW